MNGVWKKTSGMQTGTLKRWCAEKGFGFLTPDDGTPDTFAHINELMGGAFQHIQEGARVRVEIGFDRSTSKHMSYAAFFNHPHGGP